MHIIKYYWSIYSLSYICRYLEIITIWYQLFCGLIWKSPLTLLYLVSIFYLCLVKNVLKTLISNQEINDSIYWVHTSIYFWGKYLLTAKSTKCWTVCVGPIHIRGLTGILCKISAVRTLIHTDITHAKQSTTFKYKSVFCRMSLPTTNVLSTFVWFVSIWNELELEVLKKSVLLSNKDRKIFKKIPAVKMYAIKTCMIASQRRMKTIVKRCIYV